MCTEAAILVLSLLGGVTACGGDGAGESSDGPARPLRGESALVLRDARDDVWLNSNIEGVPSQPVTKPTADVLTVAAQYQGRRLRVEMQFVDLAPVGEQTYTLRYATNRNRNASAVVFADARKREGEAFLFFGDFRVRPCPRFTHQIDYDAGLVTMKIPRGCLGRPQWIRLAFSNTLQLEIGQDSRTYTDNPRNDRDFSRGFDRIAWYPRD